MNLLTKQTDYAVRALMHIAKSSSNIVSTLELERALGVPRPILRKVLQVLQKEDILTSTKGSGGGFAMAKAPKEIFLSDLIEIFQGKFSMANCFFRKNICSERKTCTLHQQITGIEDVVLKRLNTITIQKLIKGETK